MSNVQEMYRVSEVKSIHEGGTKFYAAYLIEERGTGKSALIFHYGKTQFERAPKLGGVTSLEIDSTNFLRQSLNEKLREKKKRGYELWIETTKEFDFHELRTWMDSKLSIKDIEPIHGYFFDDTIEQPPKVAPPKQVENVIVRPEGWGSW